MEKHDRTHRAAFGAQWATDQCADKRTTTSSCVRENSPSERGSLRSIYLAGSSPIFVAPANDGRVNFACLVQM